MQQSKTSKVIATIGFSAAVAGILYDSYYNTSTTKIKARIERVRFVILIKRRILDELIQGLKGSHEEGEARNSALQTICSAIQNIYLTGHRALIILETHSVLPHEVGLLPICLARHESVIELERLVSALINIGVPSVSCHREEVEGLISSGYCPITAPLLSSHKPGLQHSSDDMFTSFCNQLCPSMGIILGGEALSIEDVPVHSIGIDGFAEVVQKGL